MANTSSERARASWPGISAGVIFFIAAIVVAALAFCAGWCGDALLALISSR